MKYHQSVLLTETLQALGCQKGVYVDGTLGGGGHAYALLTNNPQAFLVGIDLDLDALSFAQEKLKPFQERIKLIHSDFKNLAAILATLKITAIQGVLIDLGVSSHQLDQAQRGFSFHQDGPLDMRMNYQQALTAEKVVNTYSKEKLAAIIKKYGEEKWAARIAEFIVKKREQQPLESTLDLVEVIKNAIPKKARGEGIHPGRRTFQALRIYVNDELNGLEQFIHQTIPFLTKGGRMAIISFHSLEDQIIRKTFRELSRCSCLKNMPCNCEGAKVKLITTNTKPIVSSNEEVAVNKRARTAKLRVLEKI